MSDNEHDVAPEGHNDDAAPIDDAVVEDAGVSSEAEAEASADDATVIAPVVAGDASDVVPAPVVPIVPEAEGDPVYAWAPAEERTKRKRRWPWIALPAAGIAVGLVVASMNLIAPGVSAAGVPVGGLTQSAAQQAISARVADAKITLKTEAGEVTLSGADLGASIDAAAVASEAFATAPAWKLGEWGSSSATGTVTLDDAKATAALRDAVPGSFVEPTDATIVLDKTTGVYSVTEAKDGKGYPLDKIRDALVEAVAAPTGTITTTIPSEAIPAKVTTAEARAGADKINSFIGDIGFYVGDENTVPVDKATAASWITPTLAEDGSVSYTADQAKIADFTKTLAAKVDRPVVDGVWIVDRQGNQLKDSIYTKDGVEGRTIGDVSSIASAFAKQLEQGKGHYALTVQKVEPKLTKLERWIEVDLSEQTVYVHENGKVIRTMLTSSGAAPNYSHTGEFRVNAHVVQQNMGCTDKFDYCTKDVKWVMYYNGDEAFHGTYWHNNFGTPMSHGCMNLTEDNAKWLWDWTPLGTEVVVHD